MSMKDYESGMLRGTGSAINVPLGWIPDRVIVTNYTDGDKIHIGFPSKRFWPFTSGGTRIIVPGDKIVGATSGAYAIVKDVILDTGTFAGGDAAGWLQIDEETKVGTFQTEVVYTYGNSAGSVDDMTIVVDVASTQDIDTEVAAATGNAGISAYMGSTSVSAPAAKGFTLGSTISEDAKLLIWEAVRGDERPCKNNSTIV